jgi:hypothetical protein
MTDLTHTEFLLACIAEDEIAIRARWKRGDMTDASYWGTPYQPSRLLAECEAKRRIIALHESWPTLVETPIESEMSHSFKAATGDTIGGTVLRVSKQMAWLTTREYVARFGMDPPTAPILALLTLPYADRPGCRPEWLP